MEEFHTDGVDTLAGRVNPRTNQPSNPARTPLEKRSSMKKTNTIHHLAKLVNRYIADLEVCRWLGGDRFTVRVCSSYGGKWGDFLDPVSGSIEIIHDGGCSPLFLFLTDAPDKDGNFYSPREKLTALLEERDWYCEESSDFRTIYTPRDGFL